MEHKNENERMYALLCKVVFGEADEAETREVKAALEASPELREQEAELLATVALVRGAYAGSEGEDALSSAARGTLASAAQAASQGGETPILTGGPWTSSPVLRAAAGVTLLASVAYATILAIAARQGADGTELGRAEVSPGLESRSSGGFRDDAALPSETASADRSVDSRSGTSRSEAARELADQLSGLGYDGGSVSTEEAQKLLRKYKADMDVEGLAEKGWGTDPVLVDELRFALEEPEAEAPSVLYFGRGGAAPGAPVVSLDAYGLGQPSGDPSDAAGAIALPGGGGSAGAPSVRLVAPTGPATPAEATGLSLTEAKKVPAAPPAAVTVDGGGAGLYSYEVAGEAPGGEGRRLHDLPDGSANAPNANGLPSAEAADDFFLGRGEAQSGHGDELHRRGRWSFERIQPTRLANERPHDMFFRFYGDNPFVVSKQDALSTFAADVDTASFALARRTLESGYLPQREQIRTEEFVNFATPDLAPPAEGTFALYGELAPSPFGGREDRWLLRVGVRAKDIQREERPPLALTFVVDTSGSMKEDNRLELVKHALRLLVDQLDGRDSIAIVAFSNEARSVLDPVPATAHDTIETALFGLQPGGSTNAEAGLKLGYRTAELSLAEGAQSRVVFLSDGVANVGQTDQDRIAKDVERETERGIFLNTIGVGLGNHNDVFLEQLADKGEGVCDYVGDAKDARRAIVERFVGGFVTVAKDVKIQLEFDPARVLRWRQLGYENRAVRDADFRNDAIDAGEIGAGHQVTCLYELELPSGDVGAAEQLATVRLRWKRVTPGEAQPTPEVSEISQDLRYGEIVAPSFRAASEGFRRSALGAQLAECLRRSVHVRGDSVKELGRELAQLLSDAPSEDTATIAAMTKRALDLGLKSLPGPRPEDIDAAHREAYYRALIRDLGGAETISQNRAEDGGETRDEAAYEQQIRDILNRDLKRKAH